MKITSTIYWYPWEGHGNNCNSCLLVGDKKILIDPGHVNNEFREACYDRLAAAVKNDGFDLGDIDMVLLTHCHPDHCEAAAPIIEKTGAKLAIYKDEEPVLEAIAKFFYRRPGENPFKLEPDILLQEGELEVGDITIQVLHTPGHSPGSACYYIEKDKALISGDTVFRSSIGRTDLPGGDMKAMGESISRLSGLSNVEWLIPGHMDLVEGSENVRRNFDTIKSYFFR